MELECDPDLAHHVSTRVAEQFGGIEVAARMLLTTASPNGTFDLTAGMRC